MSTQAGVGISHHRNPLVAGREAATQALESGGIETPDFIFMFASVGYDQQALVQTVRKATNDASLCGCSGEGVIAGDEADESNFSVAVMAIRSDEMHFTNGMTAGLLADSHGVGQEVAAAIQPAVEKDAVGLFVFPDGLSTNFDRFRTGFEEALNITRFFPIWGGGAGDNWQLKRTYQYCDDQVVSGGLAWALLSGRVQVASAVNHGCMPIGTKREITRADGNTIYEIDGKPAISVLKEYMSPEEIDNWTGGVVSLALGFQAPGHMQQEDDYTIRFIGTRDEETGSVGVRTEITPGTSVWMTRRDYDKINAGVDHIADELNAQIGSNTPQLVLHFDCAGRGKVMFRDHQKQSLLKKLRQRIGPDVPWLGFYTLFEIGPMNEHNCLHNYTAVVTVLHSGANGQSNSQPAAAGKMAASNGKSDPNKEFITANDSSPDPKPSTEQPSHDELQKLMLENQRLSEEVKRLVETERDLYKTQEQLDAQYRTYRQLYETGKEFNTSLEVQEMLNVATRYVQYTLNYERALVLLRSPEEDDFKVQALEGYYEEATQGAVATLRLPTEEAALAPLLSGAQHLIFPSGSEDDSLLTLGRRLGMDEGFVLMPLTGDADEIVGLLAAGNTAAMATFQTEVSENSETLVGLANLASQASIALKNARLYAYQVSTNKELKIKNQQLESFAFSAAHTLKTDWQSVGYLVDEVFELLEEAEEEETEVDVEEVVDVLQTLRPRVTKGIQTTNDLLTYARAGQANPTMQALRPLVEGVIQRVGSDTVQIDSDFPDSTLPLDDKTFPVALLQIVENAVTYGDGKPVHIGLANNQLLIRDQGRGIPRESLSTIFELFKRAATDVKGTGVGLALSKQILMAHGFELWAESEGEGKGSTFIIDFG